jgi:ribonucleoside-triphosphate reductase (formate)
MMVNWDNMPTIRVVLDDTHPDFNHSQHTSARDAKHCSPSAPMAQI